MGVSFLNTDLILQAPFDLRVLVMALEERGLVALGDVSRDDGVWSATLESDLVKPTPDGAAGALLAAVESLDRAGREAWDGCVVRRFDFGYASDGAFEASVDVGCELLGRIVAVGGSVAVTVYRHSAQDGRA